MERRLASAASVPSPVEALADAETLEWIERRAVQSLFCSASRSVREALGLRAFEAGPLFGAFAPALDILSLNRVLGLGLATEAADPAGQALDMARRSGAARVFLPVVPTPAGIGAEAALEQRGAHVHNHWVRLSLALGPGRASRPGFPGTREGRPEVRPLARSEAALFGSLAAEAFGMPAAAGSLFMSALGFPGWVHFGAFWNGELAGVGALYAEGSAGWLSYGAVRPAFRNRGIHLALLAERLRAAEERGCAVLSTETADWSLGRPSPSMRNLLRLGFEPRYRRPNRVVFSS
jgi:GNAT superfamily N-acetyltransferase